MFNQPIYYEAKNKIDAWYTYYNKVAMNKSLSTYTKSKQSLAFTFT